METLKRQTEAGIMFPGQYPKEEENSNYKFPEISYNDDIINNAKELDEIIDELKDKLTDEVKIIGSNTKTIIDSDEEDDDENYEYDYGDEENSDDDYY